MSEKLLKEGAEKLEKVSISEKTRVTLTNISRG